MEQGFQKHGWMINKISVFRGKKLMLNMVQGNQCNIDVTQPMYMQRNEISQQGIIYVASIYVYVYGSNSTRVKSSPWDWVGVEWDVAGQ